jgi:DNA-directed RNA polymerase subunit E'/Rpb7
MINNPYISTYLTGTVRILPREMDNNIRKYIKLNLEKEHNNRCYQDYGYIVKIHELELINDGRIIPEDPMCCAKYDVKFLCTLCRPINNTYIIAQINGITDKLIILKNGPLNIIIKPFNSLNKDKFTYNQNLSSWIAKKDASIKNEAQQLQQKFIILKKGTYIRVKITSKKIIDKSNEIICFGFMEDISTDSEIETHIRQIYEPKKYDNIEDFFDVEKKVQEAMLENTESSNLNTENSADINNDL